MLTNQRFHRWAIADSGDGAHVDGSDGVRDSHDRLCPDHLRPGPRFANGTELFAGGDPVVALERAMHVVDVSLILARASASGRLGAADASAHRSRADGCGGYTGNRAGREASCSRSRFCPRAAQPERRARCQTGSWTSPPSRPTWWSTRATPAATTSMGRPARGYGAARCLLTKAAARALAAAQRDAGGVRAGVDGVRLLPAAAGGGRLRRLGARRRGRGAKRKPSAAQSRRSPERAVRARLHRAPLRPQPGEHGRRHADSGGRARASRSRGAAARLPRARGARWRPTAA